MKEEITNVYGNRLRTRVCGLCFREDQLLMVNHLLYGHDFWSPPGGGISFGETCHAGLTREFVEETGLQVEVGGFHFVCEFLQPPLHAIELFFAIRTFVGNIGTGNDPETTQRVIRQVKWMSQKEVYRLPEKQRHGIFRHAADFASLRALHGYYKI